MCNIVFYQNSLQQYFQHFEISLYNIASTQKKTVGKHKQIAQTQIGEVELQLQH